MTKDDKPTKLVPRLRFPEFQDAGVWVQKPISKLCHILNNRRVPVTTSDRVPGPYPYYGASGVVDYVNDYIFDERLVLVGEDGAKWEAFEPTAFIADGKYWVNNHAHVLQPHGIVDNLLVAFLTMSDVGRFVTGAAPPKLTLGGLKKIPVPIPPDSAEQRKIAECLGSLDDLIAAETDALAALRRHKIGLMQQLFPRPGETRPRLRFPEFQDAKAWEEKPLKKIAKNLDSKRVPITGNNRQPGDVPYYGASGIVDYVAGHLFDEDLLCVSEDGANLLARTYPIAFAISGKTWVNNHAHVLRFKSPHAQTMVEEYLNSIDLKDFITGMAQPKLNRANLDLIPIRLPVDQNEQQRIAGCLTSLNTRLSALASKLDTLRQHKRGLMQNLFPAAEGYCK